MPTRRIPLFPFALFAAFAATSAAAADGPYGGISGGGNHERDQDLGTTNGTLGFDDGGIGTASLGYGFSSGWRPEIEYAFRSNDASSVNGASSDGTERANAGMANLWYDFHTGWLQNRLRPYLGAGVGEANVRMDQVRDATGARRDDSDNAFAYQGGAGIGYNATQRLVLSLGYRYLETNKAHFAGSPGTAGTVLTPPTPGAAPVDARYRSDGVLAGLRYSFGASPERIASAAPVAAAAAPQPEPQPQQAEVASFETVVLRPVNFQLNKADLTEPSKATLDELAQKLAAHPEMTATIEGYTDSTGTPDYNKQLGQKRAESVRDYLAGKGVDASKLQVASGGQDNPVADNKTWEGRSQNRRAEINPGEKPDTVKVVIEAPTPDSVEAAKQRQ